MFRRSSQQIIKKLYYKHFHKKHLILNGDWKKTFSYLFASIRWSNWPPCLAAVQTPPLITCSAGVHLLRSLYEGTFNHLVLYDEDTRWFQSINIAILSTSDVLLATQLQHFDIFILHILLLGDQINMAVCFWYLVKRDSSSVQCDAIRWEQYLGMKTQIKTKSSYVLMIFIFLFYKYVYLLNV